MSNSRFKPWGEMVFSSNIQNDSLLIKFKSLLPPLQWGKTCSMALNEKLAGLELCVNKKWFETLWVVSLRFILPRCSNMRVLSGRMVFPMYCKPHSHSAR
ncbi:hypothetical protein FKM82_031077 [Ascaphus truei]